MLSVSKAIKAGQGEYYLSLAATDDYYQEGSEPSGFWLGQGATALGLADEVQPQHFRNLLQGLSPDGERKLVRNADAERRAGWDLCWSVPKSVSVLWSQASPEVRNRIEDCVSQGVRAGVQYLEEVAGITRRGEDGYIREKAQLIFACFQHSTSRAQDPQLHIHAILQNVAVRSDGTTGTVEPREIYRHQMAAGTLFRAELAARLERELGLRAVREGRVFELLGVDRALMETFSQRRAQVLEALQRLGVSGGKAAEIAALDTRPEKDSVSREELFERWQETGRKQGWSAKEVSLLLRLSWPARDAEKEIQQAATAALEKLTSTKSHFALRELTQAIAEEAQGRNLGAKEVAAIEAGLLGSPELVCLGTHRGEVHWTTQEILALEKKLLAHCQTLHQREILFPTTQSALPSPGDLSGEQRAALQHVTEAQKGVRVVTGMAGTGKSTLFRVARGEWEKQGCTVVGAALSGKAARGLEESTGISSQTLHRTLLGIERGDLVLNDKTVLLIDEAAMVGSRQLGVVVEKCVEAGSTLILAGDARQLQAIELGGAFSEISRRYGNAELTEIRRQREGWAREAVKSFAEGQAVEALCAYVERDLVSESAEGRWGAMERLIADWSKEDPLGDRERVILGGTNADVSVLNSLAQEARKKAGHLGKEGGAVGKETLFAGDRVLFTKNSMALGVMNGDRGRVCAVGEGTFTVELDAGGRVQVETERYSHLCLGYALTTHKSQGMTVEKAFILVSRQNDLEMSYVQASRARGETRWYVGEELAAVARSMEKSHRKQMATNFGFWAEPELELLPHR